MLAEADVIPQGFGTVLVLEDEALVSTMMEDLLLELGAARVVTCGSIRQAYEIVEAMPVDCAILDVWIGDDMCWQVADALSTRGVPFFFSSASGPESICERHRHRPLLSKPFSDQQLVELFRATILGSQPA